MAADRSLIQSLRGELPRCARHKDASHIDCGECMYLSSHIYAPLEQIERVVNAANHWGDWRHNLTAAAETGSLTAQDQMQYDDACKALAEAVADVR